VSDDPDSGSGIRVRLAGESDLGAIKALREEFYCEYPVSSGLYRGDVSG
jgi:hypothetical protein